MSIAEQAVSSHLHFEAIKAAYRQTKDGFAITLVVNPHDMPDALATAPLGTRYVAVLVEIGDDEKPVLQNTPPPIKSTGDLKVALLASEAVEHRKNPHLSLVGKQHYANADKMEQARIDCIRRCKSPHFWRWLGPHITNEQDARAAVHEALEKAGYADDVHQVVSRGDIAKNSTAYDVWLTMETQYLADTGQMAESR